MDLNLVFERLLMVVTHASVGTFRGAGPKDEWDFLHTKGVEDRLASYHV